MSEPSRLQSLLARFRQTPTTQWEGGTIVGEPTIVPLHQGDQNGPLQVIGKGLDNALWTLTLDTQGRVVSPWSSLGGQTTNTPSAIMDRDNTLHVFVRGQDGGVWEKTQTGGTWNDWSEVPGGGKIQGSPQVGLTKGGAIQVSGTGLDNARWENTLDGTTWGGWQQRDAPPVASPTERIPPNVPSPPNPTVGGGAQTGGSGTLSFPPVPLIPMPPGTALPPMPTVPTGPAIPAQPPDNPFAAFSAALPGLISQQQTALTNANTLISQLSSQAAANRARIETEGPPLMDAATRNLQAILNGQRASPALEGLVASTFDPLEAESQRRLRQTAEEAAASRGLHLTDTPIGQPFLLESRRLTEDLAGQRAGALLGLRTQDAQLAQSVRALQEQVRQQAQSGQLDLARALASPQTGQFAQSLGMLNLAGQQTALDTFRTQAQTNLTQQAQNLQNALGMGGLAINRAGVGLTQQGQSLQQLLAQQQQALQAQQIALSALGAPQQALQWAVPTAQGLDMHSFQQLLSAMSMLGGGGVPPLGAQGSTSTQSPGFLTQFPALLGGLGAAAYGTGALTSGLHAAPAVTLGSPAIPAGMATAGGMTSGVGTAGAAAPGFLSSLWAALPSWI